MPALEFPQEHLKTPGDDVTFAPCYSIGHFNAHIKLYNALYSIVKENIYVFGSKRFLVFLSLL